MNIRSKIILLAAVISAVAIIAVLLFSQKAVLVDDIAVNKEIAQIRSFSVSSGSTDLNTSATGTVFIKGDGEVPTHAQIVATIDIAPKDWGGVAFYIPKKWYIANITSSYPESKESSDPANNLFTVTSYQSNSNDWRAWIEVGSDHSYKPKGGGRGTIVIDLVSDQAAIDPSENFHLSVAVGSDEKNGIRIAQPDSVHVSLSLEDDE